jgi:hypothetical protein
MVDVGFRAVVEIVDLTGGLLRDEVDVRDAGVVVGLLAVVDGVVRDMGVVREAGKGRRTAAAFSSLDLSAMLLLTGNIKK